MKFKIIIILLLTFFSYSVILKINEMKIRHYNHQIRLLSKTSSYLETENSYLKKENYRLINSYRVEDSLNMIFEGNLVFVQEKKDNEFVIIYKN